MNSQPISLIRGHDSVVPVRIELGYAPLDLSTATAATFTAKPGEFSTVVKITKTLGSGVTAGSLGLANISFSVADMAELDVSNSYTWSLTATVGGVASIVARGVLTAIGAPQQFPDNGSTAASIAAADITDASASGITVLTGTPAEARAAIGFGGTVTVAQLNAAGADARSALYYCSDCLTVNGPGSLVAWCGRTLTWRTLDDCLLATADLAEWVNDFIKNSNSSELVGSKAALFCRTSAGAGADQFGSSGGTWRQYPSASAQRYSIMALTNNAATNYARFYSQGIAFAQSPQAKPMVFSGVRGLTLGSIGTGFSVRLGIGVAPNASLSAAENSVVYDKGDVLGGLNAGGESAWLGCIRSGSVNLAGSGSLGVGPTVDTEEDLCVIRNGDSVSIYRNGVAVGSGTANAYDIQTMSPFFIVANDGTSVVSQRAIMRGFCLGYYMP
jgi:hypothetical protein